MLYRSNNKVNHSILRRGNMNNKNVVFLSLTQIYPSNINSNGIYTSLLTKFAEDGFKVYIINPVEKRFYNSQHEKFIDTGNLKYLNIPIGNITETNKIEKGISTIEIGRRYIREIKKYLGNVKFDLILYPTPPITFYNVVKYLKRRDGAITYLMLKDIFPQNAVDLNYFSDKSPIYFYFRNKEKKLYSISDYIGCMSQANVDYILEHNTYINPQKLEILPNSIDPIDISISEKEKNKIREKYKLPLDKKIYIYGGNLGKPQGIDFMIDCLKSQESNKKEFFLIIGSGTEFHKISSYVEENKPNNVKLMKSMPKDCYDEIVSSCDVGLIFLDYRFTIPNFPSRLLGYLQAKLPVLAVTDKTSDIRCAIEEGKFGWWCESNSVDKFVDTIDLVRESNLGIMGNNAIKYLENHYSSVNTYNKIFKRDIK